MQVSEYQTASPAVNLTVSRTDAPQRPRALTVRRDGIPAELAELRQWLVWRFEPRAKGEGWTKVPYSPRNTTRRASSTNPNDWGTLADVFRVMSNHPGYFDGAGFVFTADDAYTGIDLDQCRDPETGVFTDFARRVIRDMGSYAELSPSGRGVHIIVRAELAGKGRKTPEVEMYDRARFFTITGQSVADDYGDVVDAQAQVTALYDALAPARPEQGAPRPITPVSLEDAHILELAQRARNGEKVRALYNGDTSGYPSHSEADMAFVRMIAFYTQDEAQLERIWRSSGLWREKGDTNSVYAPNTIANAIAGLTDVYEPPADVARLIATRTPEPAPIDAPEDDYLRAELERKEAELAALYRAILNPELNAAELKAAASALLIARQKEPNHNGRVDVSDREIGHDWRARGQAFNGKDGSRPRLSARAAKQAMEKLATAGVIEAEKRPHTVRPKGRAPFQTTVWEIERVIDPVTYWSRLADYTTDVTDTPKMRKTREANKPCPACGEVHAVRKTVTCEGCGAIRKSTVQEPDWLTDEDRERLMSENPHGVDTVPQEPVQATIATEPEPEPDQEPEPETAPAPVQHTRARTPLDRIASRIMAPHDEPGDGAQAASDVRTCCDCGELTTNRYRCDTCIDAAAESAP